MPLVMLKTNVELGSEKKEALAVSLSAMLAEATGKPEAYVMASVDLAAGCFAGTPGPMAFADVRGIGGLNADVNAAIMGRLTALLGAELDIPADSVYANFTEVEASNWGWKDGTFA